MKTAQPTLRAMLGLVLAMALATACAGMKTPMLAVDAVHVGRASLTHLPLEVVFRVRNPNPEPMAIDRFDYELFLNGRRIGRGFEPRGLDLEGFGEGRVRTHLDLNMLSVPGAVKRVLDQDRAHARVKGRFYARGGFGARRLGFNSDAEVDLGGR